MTMPGALLAFEAVQLARGAVCDLSVPPHHAVAVSGPEDSGVGSLARVALGLERPPNGRALIMNTEIARLPRAAALAFRRRVGYLPAGDGLLQNLSLQDNIALPLRFGTELDDDAIEGRIRIILTMMHLTDVSALRPAHVNEEQRRRAALARAVVFDPELVLMEQPFDGLTDRAAAELLEVARGGVTAGGSRRTVFITGQDLPHLLRARVDSRYRVVGSTFLREA
ncbi:MAG TPA: ATP-binding cassette domain-containing protein [Gemmatimonadales bacterium]|nr:ATP-binding cassette domain-containing protein [Gemmatimonadales bacterium]